MVFHWWIKKINQKLPDYRTRIQTKPEVMKMRGLKNTLCITTKHFPVNFNIFGQTVDVLSVITHFTRHIYIIEKFKPKMFIKNDILNSEIMVPDIGKNQLTIGNFKNMKIKFNVKNIDFSIKRMVRFNRIIKIPARFNSIIFFKLQGKNFPAGRNFMFIPKKIVQLKNNGGMLSHIINVHTTSV